MQNNKECGRTLLEMLGVLFIMGFFAIASVKFYHFLVEKMKIQNTARIIKGMALERQNSAISATSDSRRRVEGPHSELYLENGTEGKFANYFWVDTTLNNEDFCQGVKEADIIGAEFVLGECPGKISFYFKKTPNILSGAGDLQVCTEDGQCGECEHCGENGLCMGCPEGETCAKSFDDPGAERACYPDDDLVGGALCAYPDGNGNCCDSKGQNCCPPDKPIMGKNGTCYGCDENEVIEVDEKTQTCSRCANRTYRTARRIYVGWCIPDECPSETPLMSYTGKCYPCETAVYMRDGISSGVGNTAACAVCPESALFDDRICIQCPDNMIVQDGNCICSEGYMAGYPSNNYTAVSATCHSCGTDNLNAIVYTKNNTQNPCSACSNRIIVQPQINYYYYCALETCPDGYMHDRYGHCKSCTQNADINFKPSSLTNSCSECGGMRYTDGNYCKKCPVDTSGLTEEQQTECTNDCLVYNATTKIWEDKCTKVEYLESTGTQYIDTGFVVGETGKIETVIEIPANRLTWDRKLFGSIDNNKVGMCMNIYQGKYRGTNVDVSASKTEIQIVRGTSTVTASISYDGNTYNVSSFWHSNPAKIDTFPIFAGTDTQVNGSTNISKSQYKCYYFKQYDLNGTLVRDFIPVLDPNGTPAMYDQVEKKLYYNAGTGTFSYGPVVN